MNPKIFKAYDIRGIYDEDLDDETAYKLGLAYSAMRRKELAGKENIQIVVGMDMRVSSPALKERLIDGLIDGGTDVVDIGLSSTPTFYFAVAHFKYAGGIIVSASHNPKEYNGFKLVREKAIPIGKGTGIFELRDIATKDNLEKTNKKGKVVKREDILKEQVKHDLNYTNIKNIKPFKIVIDTANAMGSLYFDALFKYLPCEVVKMNWKLDGTFPSHEADPLKPENMRDLGEKVLEEKADLGIATDGDGDRIFFTDNDGGIVEPGIVRAILCKLFLLENPGAKIAYDIRPGKITLDTITENGGIPIVTPVGHSLIKALAIKEDVIFAGESSGHFFLNMDEGCYEIPLIVTLKILEELSKSNQSFSNYVKPYKKYSNSGEINSEVENANAKIQEIKEKYKDGNQNELDGVTVEYSDWWFNVRPSNTEPLLRLNLEAKSQKIMEEKRDELLKLIRG